MKLFLILSFLLLSLPGFSQGDDDKMIQDIEKYHQKKSTQVNEIKAKLQQKPRDFVKELEKMGYSTIDAAALMDERVIKLLKEAINEMKIENVPPEFHKAVVMGKVKGTPWETIFEKNPKLLSISAGILADKRALLGMFGILERKSDIKLFGIICLFILVASWVLKKIMIDKSWNRLHRYSLTLFISVLSLTVSMAVFYQLFKEELTPSIQIVRKHF